MLAATPSLAAAQQALLDALFVRPGGEAAQAADRLLAPWLADTHPQSGRGLSAYRSNGHALAERSLAAAYPVVAAVLGDESVSMLARALWHLQPPDRGDLAQWGHTLPGFVQDDPQLAELPWLADLARVEWALHAAATDADQALAPDSFALLQSPDPGGVRLRLAPGVCVVQSPWPVVSIVLAHKTSELPLAEAWRRCQARVAETALVWRAGLQPMVSRVTPVEAALIGLLMQGADLPQALDAACALADASGDPFDFGAWLAAAVQSGLVLGATFDPPHRIPQEMSP